MDEMNFGGWLPLIGAALLRSNRLSAAGRMLDQLDAAERAVATDDDITDELRCALRRADIKQQRGIA